MQQQFASVKLRTTLRSMVQRYVTCRKRRAETISPMMTDLPRERLAFKEPPFTNTGVDSFGTFYVSVKRSTEKRWGFLFTCLTTRRVHFEVLPSMDTSSCVMGIERFTACRGITSVLWSDNGTNFFASQKNAYRTIPVGTNMFCLYLSSRNVFSGSSTHLVPLTKEESGNDWSEKFQTRFLRCS